MMKMQKKILLALFVGTIIKAIIIFFFYQNVIVFEGNKPRLASGYGWGQLVESIQEGKYEMLAQTGLSDIYDLRSKSYRPPVYPLLLLLISYLSNYSGIILILFQSIITSVVGYLGYMIVKTSTNAEMPATLCLGTLFFMPMNFLKSGTIDEAPILLVFILTWALTFIKYLQNQKGSHLLFLSGISLGVATLTRQTALVIATLVIFFMLASKSIKEAKLKKIVLFAFAYLLVLSPWILRNFLVYGEFRFSSGSGRILLFTQSKEFIQRYPADSVDDIEREFLRSFQKAHPYLSNLDELSLDKEFNRFALNEMIRYPGKYAHSLILKLKVIFAYKYYPITNNKAKNVTYALSYTLPLMLFIFGLILPERTFIANRIILIALAGIIIPGIIFFVESRHLYVPAVLMIIYIFSTYYRHFYSIQRIKINEDKRNNSCL